MTEHNAAFSEADRENDFNQAVRLLKLINKELQNLPPTSTQLFNSEISESINKFAEKYT